MRYLSTRGGLEPACFSDILLGGLAPDGGRLPPAARATVGFQGLSTTAASAKVRASSRRRARFSVER